MVSCGEGELTEGEKQVLSRLEHHEDAVHLAVLQELLVVTVTERGEKRVRQCVCVCVREREREREKERERERVKREE